eukprot:1246493-Pyramimonas_sp.AAC.1
MQAAHLYPLMPVCSSTKLCTRKVKKSRRSMMEGTLRHTPSSVAHSGGDTSHSPPPVGLRSDMTQDPSTWSALILCLRPQSGSSPQIPTLLMNLKVSRE